MIQLRSNIATQIVAMAVLIVATSMRMPAQSITTPEAVTTYHYNALRTGWNSNETVLTPSNVNSSTFVMLHSITLDEQVDAQPLIIPNEKITAGSHQGTFEVAYVVTENNTIYAIDTESGTVLLTRHLGSAVPKPLGCGNNSAVVGINSTPVIDRTANVMYVISYTLQTTPVYHIHELDLGNLTDKVTPVVVAGSHLLTDGSTYKFNPSNQRQRPGLLDANGNIYAGFGSFCDFRTSSTRGWVLGWQKGTLTPLTTNKLTDTQTAPKSTYYLSSVWMSGYGVAADGSGDIYFITGNSDKTNNVYDGVTDIQESVVKLSHSNLNTILSIFTPADEFALDQADRDYGSAGVLLLPDQPGTVPRLAVAGGKEGNMFLLNRDKLGGFTSNNGGALGVVSIGACWCGQSYFNNGVPHVVTSGSNIVHLWDLQTSSTANPKLVSVATNSITSGQDHGFFTSVSSSGANNAIIWAVSRPVSSTNTSVSLFAFNAKPSGTTLPLLFSAVAGAWPHTGGNANIVPVVANGQVYVASDKQLSIFGLKGSSSVTATPVSEAVAQNVFADPSQHEIFGTISSVNGSQLTVQTRTGSFVQVDASAAIQNDLCVDLQPGGAVDVQGTYDASGVLLASSIQRAKDSPALWPSDI